MGRQAAIRQSLCCIWVQGVELCAAGELLPKLSGTNLSGNSTGGAGKDYGNGIRNFACNGAQSLASYTRGLRKESDSPVFRDLAETDAVQPRRRSNALRSGAHA
jgi:hypothetical protein